MNFSCINVHYLYFQKYPCTYNTLAIITPCSYNTLAPITQYRLTVKSFRYKLFTAIFLTYIYISHRLHSCNYFGISNTFFYLAYILFYIR